MNSKQEPGKGQVGGKSCRHYLAVVSDLLLEQEAQQRQVLITTIVLQCPENPEACCPVAIEGPALGVVPGDASKLGPRRGIPPRAVKTAPRGLEQPLLLCLDTHPHSSA
jgi:hypothetical protein